MAEETVGAASSSANESGFTQFDGWDEDGQPIVIGKSAATEPEKADTASADAQEKTETEDAAGSAAKKTQEQSKRRPDVEERFKKLTDEKNARIAALERELAEAKKPKATENAESSTARQNEPRSAEPQPTRTKPTQTDKGEDGKPKYPTYEDFVEDLADWKAEQRMAAERRAEEETRVRQGVEKQLKEARGRYEDFDTATKPLLNELTGKGLRPEVFAVINDSPVLADLLYALSGKETQADFLDACRTNPGKAMRVALLVEQEVMAELAKNGGAKDGAGKGEAGKAAAETKPRAPKPPSEVGGRGATGEDALVSAAKNGDFRSFEAEQTRRALAARR